MGLHFQQINIEQDDLASTLSSFERPGLEDLMQLIDTPTEPDVPQQNDTTNAAATEINTVFEAILKHGHDEDFIPEFNSENFLPTDAPAGSSEKIEVLRKRVAHGLPL